MKNKFFSPLFACSLISLLAASCIDDKGNYEYEDANKVMPVTISGMRDTSVIMGSVLRIVPEVQHAENGDYVYSWFIMPSVTAGNLPRKTVLSNEIILDVPIKFDAGSYFLNFEVRDPKIDVYVRKQIRLNLTATDINTGWFILKDVGDETDFDYISRDGTLYVQDVLLNRALPEGSRPKGTAIQMNYQSQRYYQQVTDDEGKVTTLANQQVYHILSSHDIKTFNATTLVLFKNYEDQFYGVLPENCNPQGISMRGTGDLYLLNDGKIYTIYGMVANVGKFGAPKPGFYTMFKDLFTTGSGALCFDIESSTFYHITTSGSNVTPLNEESEGVANPIGVSPRNMPYTMLNLLKADATTSASGVAVMKSKSEEKYYFASINYAGAAYPFRSFDLIPAQSKMPLAKVKAGPYSGSFVWFADANNLYVYKNADVPDREPVLMTYPVGETISYITHLFASGSYNYLVVLTNNATGWKLYVYNIISEGNPEIIETPAFTSSGSGFGRFVIYR